MPIFNYCSLFSFSFSFFTSIFSLSLSLPLVFFCYLIPFGRGFLSLLPEFRVASLAFQPNCSMTLMSLGRNLSQFGELPDKSLAMVGLAHAQPLVVLQRDQPLVGACETALRELVCVYVCVCMCAYVCVSVG